MKIFKGLVVAALALMLSGASVPAQQRRRGSTPTTRSGRPPAPAPTPRRSSTPPAQRSTAQTQAATASALTGLWRLDEARSDRPAAVARRASDELVFGERERVVEDLTTRLTSPYQLSIQRRGQTIEIASTRAPRIAFVADGSEQAERGAEGHTVRTRAVLYGDQLMVTSTGRPEDDFRVNFDPVEGGRRLRVTRRIHSAALNRPIVIQSFYDKVSPVARWSVYGEQPPPPAQTARNVPGPRRNQPAPGARRQTPDPGRRQQPPSPPVITRRVPPEPAPAGLPDLRPGTRFVATLDRDLSTEHAREGDPFTMTVRAPSEFAGATVEGRVSRVNPSGRVTGRSEMSFAFERLRLRDGRTLPLAATVESVRGDDVRVDAETGGSIEEGDSQSQRTAQRVAIGAAVGAIIGAISGGGRGAVIGAAVGAGAGAGSVYAQGRDHLELPSGTEFIFVASARR
ncbi:MAG TPA: YMGG-like glycine zipper-containing protein [Pyrinomonadaceae bacterium]|nr:YMGG-like glycine zipper-containing protein [Pyrinomonadaceae bacterium]